MTRAIYVDEETRQIENEILNKEPEFNFSSFYKSALIQLKCNNQNQSFEVLNAKLEEARFKMNQSSEEVKYFEKLIQKAVKDREDKIEIDNHNKKISQEKKEKAVAEQVINIRFFYEVTDPKVIQDLALEFVNEHFYNPEGMDLLTFMNFKGYKEKCAIQVKTNSKEFLPPKQEKEITINQAVKNKEYEELMKIALGEKEYE